MEVTRDDKTEQEFLERIQVDGWRIRCHLPYNELTEKVRQHVALWLHDAMYAAVNVVASVSNYQDLLKNVNPTVSFYEKDAFNIKTEKPQLLREFKIHDTVDRLLFSALGSSLEELYIKMKIVKPLTKSK
jgi:hypothetical protein